jgi:hypothetical protein
VDVAPVKGQRKRLPPPPLTRPAGMFICPHHRCCACNRSTASAGGLLFRCTGCMTAYCEDCLPQDEIDSVGRCKPLEKLGYDSKQSYYIRCPYCCQLDGFKPQGILTDKDETSAKSASNDKSEGEKSGLSGSRSATSLPSMGDKDGIDDEDVGEDEVPDAAEAQAEELESAEEPIVPLKTQLMRIQWSEIFPTPPPSPVKKSKSGKKGKKGQKGKKGGKSKVAAVSSGGKRKLEVAAESDESSDEGDSEDDSEDAEEEADSLTDAALAWREWSQPSADKTKRARMDKFAIAEDTAALAGMQQLLEHPLWTALRQARCVVDSDLAKQSAAEQKDDDLQLFSHIFSKVASGKIFSRWVLV